MDEKRYILLTRIAIVLTVAWVGWTIFDSGYNELEPGTYELDAARNNLEDGRFEESLALFSAVYKKDTENLGALRGMAQALMQMGAHAEQPAFTLDCYNQAMSHYNEAIEREKKREKTPLRQRIMGVAYANRGILRDRMGDYPGALSDYDRSMQLEPEVVEGPGFLTRFMRNQAEKPPTIADRARYLRAELTKPENERLLRIPALDARQRAYGMD